MHAADGEVREAEEPDKVEAERLTRAAVRSRTPEVATTTEGNVATTIEFDGPANDPVPPDFATELGQKQDTAIRDWQAV